MHLKRKIYKKGKMPNLKKKLSGEGLNGKSKDMSRREVAKMHGIDYDDFWEELEMGTIHELEHTSDRKVAERIALDHLYEDPKYYEKLEAAGLKHGGKTKDKHTYRWIYKQSVKKRSEGGAGVAVLRGVLEPVSGIKVISESSPNVSYTSIKIFATDRTALRNAGRVLVEYEYIPSVRAMEDYTEYLGK